MSIATTAAIVCGAAAAVATSDCTSRNWHPTKYDGWIVLGIVAVEVGAAMLCRFWPW